MKYETPYSKKIWAKASEAQKAAWIAIGYVEPISDDDFGSHNKAANKELGLTRHKQAREHAYAGVEARRIAKLKEDLGI